MGGQFLSMIVEWIICPDLGIIGVDLYSSPFSYQTVGNYKYLYHIVYSHGQKIVFLDFWITPYFTRNGQF